MCSAHGKKVKPNEVLQMIKKNTFHENCYFAWEQSSKNFQKQSSARVPNVVVLENQWT